MDFKTKKIETRIENYEIMRKQINLLLIVIFANLPFFYLKGFEQLFVKNFSFEDFILYVSTFITVSLFIISMSNYVRKKRINKINEIFDNFNDGKNVYYKSKEYKTIFVINMENYKLWSGVFFKKSAVAERIFIEDCFLKKKI